MNGFRAVLYKDFKLFLQKSGFLGFLLPFLLALLLSAGISDISKQTVVQPFQIAVRDQDNTIMSRSLISQIKKVDIFSQVTRITDETDQEVLADGNVAVITIPHNFFYDMYQTTQENTVIKVRLNRNRKVDAMIFQSVFTSVMDMIHSEWASERSVYLLQYGKLTNDQEISLFYEASDLLLKDALGRQNVFDSAQQIADTVKDMGRRLAATILTVMFLHISTEAVKTLPEELRLGIIPRFHAFGGKLAGFILSKWIMSLVLSAPTVLLIFLWQKPTNFMVFFLFMSILQIFVFLLMLTISIWTQDSLQTQRWGNLLVLFSLVAGGTLWPDNFLIPEISWIKNLNFSYYANIGLRLIIQNEKINMLFFEIRPILWIIILLCLVLWMKTFHIEKNFFPVKQFCYEEKNGIDSIEKEKKQINLTNTECAVNSTWIRIFRLTKMKLNSIVGGFPLVVATVLVILFCGIMAGSLTNGKTEMIHLGILDQDGSMQSEQLIQNLMKTEGIKVFYADHTKKGRYAAQKALLNGQIEGLLTIRAGYGTALSDNQGRVLHYESTSSALSAQGVREIIAGEVTSQKCRERAVVIAENKEKRKLNETEKQHLEDLIAEQERQLPMYYHIEMADGSVPIDPFVPQRISFAALCTLLLLFTAASWCESPDSKLVNVRLQSIHHGKCLAYGSDFLVLMLLGTGTAFLVMLPYGMTGRQIAALIAYVFCCTAFARLIALITVSETGIDALAPFLALILCLAGGCFGDLSHVSHMLAQVSILVPPGAVASAADGNKAAFLILMIEGCTAITANFIVKRQ